MKNTVKSLVLGLVLVGGALSANAATLDVVRDARGTPVKAMSGDCLRFNQASAMDPCGPQMQTMRGAVYFDFGSAKLTAKGKAALDEIAASIKAAGSVTGVRVAGYADRIGSAAANEKLSKRRADAVRQYLTKKGIVNAQVVETRWFGDSAPATTCDKGLSKKKLIACLQPDRRVEVEFDVAPAAAK